ncbi:hypothetical protein IWQ60_007601 [Tieghemiomyces parasiticus]|uniref:Uncharacterized protein n=1 Tax=Tieghemiomyces parasiticus TaxID=78921 RepID=A0A9W8DNM1_9FUNG|nr:hypothetical protein IWQ60_007601 [Tieghemiomyces parasiticus]
MGCCNSRQSDDDDSAAASPLLGDRDVPSYLQNNRLRSRDSTDSLDRQAEDDREYQRKILSQSENQLIQATQFTKYNVRSAEDIDYLAGIYRELIQECNPPPPVSPSESIDLSEHTVRGRHLRTASLDHLPPPSATPENGSGGRVWDSTVTNARMGSVSLGRAGHHHHQSVSPNLKSARHLAADTALASPLSSVASGLNAPTLLELFHQAPVMDDNLRLINHASEALEATVCNVQIENVGRVVVPLDWRSKP